MEKWDLYTWDRVKTGKTMYRGDPIPEGYYHLVVHICVFNDRGEMLIQRRQPFKQGWPGMWDVSVGGSAVEGDNSSTAAARELGEELGIEYDFASEKPLFTVYFPGGFDDYYAIRKNVEPEELHLQYEEVAETRWADLTEILSMVEEGSFIPYRKELLTLLFRMRDGNGALIREETNKA